MAAVNDLQDAVTLAAELAPMTLAESTLETAISVTCAELSLATTVDERREVYERMCRLCEQRTAAQIERMERMRGLRG